MPMGAPEERTHVGPLSRPEWRRGRARTGVAGVGLADDIRGEGADGGNGDLVRRLGGEFGHGWGRMKGWGGGRGRCSYIPALGLATVTDI